MRSIIAVSCLSSVVVFSAALNQVEASDWNFVVGAKLQGAEWSGENEASNDTFDAKAGQLRLDLRLSKGRFYSGFSFQGGEYEFDGDAPDKVFKSSRLPSSDVTIERSEVDLAFGYYVWRYVSVFVALKSMKNEWEGEGYTLEQGGAGVGMAGYRPLSKKWIFYGSLGFVKLDLETDGTEIGTANGSALELGAMYMYSQAVNFTLSLKAQRYEYDFDEGSNQAHDINGLVFGVNYAFGS